jgi:hypothetical protein
MRKKSGYEINSEKLLLCFQEYVRVAFDAKTPETPVNLIRLFREIWHLPEPDFVVSIIGGFSTFKMNNEKLSQIFNEGLINVRQNTDFLAYNNALF